MGWDVRVHVKLHTYRKLRQGWGGVGWDVNVHVKVPAYEMLRQGWGGMHY